MLGDARPPKRRAAAAFTLVGVLARKSHPPSDDRIGRIEPGIARLAEVQAIELSSLLSGLAARIGRLPAREFATRNDQSQGQGENHPAASKAMERQRLLPRPFARRPIARPIQTDRIAGMRLPEGHDDWVGQRLDVALDAIVIHLII